MAGLNTEGFLDELRVRGFDGFTPAQLTTYLKWGMHRIQRKLHLRFEDHSINFTIEPPLFQIDLANTFGTEGFWARTVYSVDEITEGSAHHLVPADADEYWNVWAQKNLYEEEHRGTPE